MAISVFWLMMFTYDVVTREKKLMHRTIINRIYIMLLRRSSILFRVVYIYANSQILSTFFLAICYLSLFPSSAVSVPG